MSTTRSSAGSMQRPAPQFLRNLIYLGFHGSLLCLFWCGVSWEAVALCVGMYFVRMFGITAGYHRLFAHKSYKTSRVVQFILAFIGSTALQKGVLWWAAHHRNHHTLSDMEGDVHSPKLGFWWSHMMWVADKSSDKTHWDKVPDLAKYPELRALNALHMVIFVSMCVAFNFLIGFQFMVWGCFVSTILLWHGTFTINSLSHMFGKRVYATTDTSRNNFVLALVTMGEGWHNNHHFYQAAAHQGFRWWEIDVSYYILVVMEKLGLIWGVKRAPQAVIEGKLGGKDYLIANGAFDVGMLAPAWDPKRDAAEAKAKAEAEQQQREPALA